MQISPHSIANLSPEDQAKFISFGLGSTYTPPFQTIHEAFEYQAAQRPSAIAVEHDGKSATYLELKQMSDRLAVALQRQGVKSGDRVLLLVQRSISMVAGMLGILKAGAAYVPQDGGIVTDSTLAHIIPDAGVQTVVCLRKFAARIPNHKTLVLEDVIDNDDYLKHVTVSGKSSDSVYAIYTSGTTGKPKGVDVTHLSVVNLLLTDPGRVGMRPGRRVAQLLNVAFDMAQWECLGSVANGCTLCIRGSDWKGVMSSVDIVIATPSVMQLYDPIDYPNIKYVATAGEPCPKPLADKLAAAGVAYYNSCGPTEVTIVNTMTPLPHAVGDEMNIGKPLPNNTVYVLDEDMNPLPIGATGIMWGGGACAARGYIGLPELTAKKFKHDPFLNDGSLMFNTGDLGKWREDGSLIHLGRADDQVKIKGFRVELDGVTASLESADGVTTACALLIGKELVGFVYPETADIEKVKEACAKVQPYYARPSRYIKLETVPKTANGKIDKRALRAMVEAPVPVAVTVNNDVASAPTIVEVETSTSRLTFTPFVAAINKPAQAAIANRLSTASVNIGNMWAQLQEHGAPAQPLQITNESFRPFNEASPQVSNSPITSGRSITSSASRSTLNQNEKEDLDSKSIVKKSSVDTVIASLPVLGAKTDLAAEKGGNAWDGYLDDELPEKMEPKYVRNLRHIVFSLYRRLFGVVFIVNMSIFIHALVEGGLPANKIGTIVVLAIGYPSDCWQGLPHGGAHSGSGISAIVWLIYFTMIWFAYPKRRSTAHDNFEPIALPQLGRHGACLGPGYSPDERLQGTRSQPGTSPAYQCFFLDDLRDYACNHVLLAKVAQGQCRSVVLSNHAIRLYFDYTTPKTGHFVRVSKSPLMEWHSFATIQEPNTPGFSLVVSRAGDWTGHTIENPPTQLWVRGVPTYGVLRIVPLFRRLVIVATGSGIGPCAPAIFEKRIPMRLLWTSPDVRKTFGNELVDKLLDASPDAVIYDTRKHGKPDMVKLTLRLVREFDAEAVAIISNQKLTEKVVYGMMSRGIPAFGAIWDS
ncbi:AMP binding enzyme [Rhizoctonia solani]|uniref:AMP binding enzyme n=1 Tax=Rhizoctonia solani TaxID=456999 RepID=A0A8H8SW57_9AGAM|nr:AMP binding enzyme [Rhizoctonia solani]QRW18853.1 AMP binding enzyme [Rhizoctonia solani]